jgi:adenine/guanine/hypoxanthine permease
MPLWYHDKYAGCIGVRLSNSVNMPHNTNKREILFLKKNRPGMGLNVYFTYQVVGYHGTGSIPYRLALTAVFVEGWIFIALSLLGMRQWLVRLLPTSLKIASACGIGLFLAIIGLSYPAGIGAITGSFPAPLDIGGCPPEFLDKFGTCTQGKMSNPQLWIGIMCGGITTVVLMAYRVRSALVIGILVVSIISWP